MAPCSASAKLLCTVLRSIRIDVRVHTDLDRLSSSISALGSPIKHHPHNLHTQGAIKWCICLCDYPVGTKQTTTPHPPPPRLPDPSSRLCLPSISYCVVIPSNPRSVYTVTTKYGLRISTTQHNLRCSYVIAVSVCTLYVVLRVKYCFR